MPPRYRWALLAVALIGGGMYWFAAGVMQKNEELFREDETAEERFRESVALKFRAFKIGYDRGREAYREDSEIPSEAVLKETARPIAVEFEVPPGQLEAFLHHYALGYGWGWDNVKTQKLQREVAPADSQAR